MKSVLITRFAIRFAEGHVRRRYEEQTSWIDYRMELFRKYCLPSVKAQTTKDFDWWFLVDPTFPGFTNAHRDELLKHGRILWIQADWREDQVEVGELLSDRYKDKWVCSMRLDSDDMICNKYIESIGALATEEEACITIRNGYMIKNNTAYLRSSLRNPFIAYIEHASPFTSVFKESHHKYYKLTDNIKIIEDIYGWVQVDHGNNIKNSVERKIGKDNLSKNMVDISLLKKYFTWS